jgi:uncharacterized RDD family membrane protein YckC
MEVQMPATIPPAMLPGRDAIAAHGSLDGVRSRRACAYLIDIVIILLIQVVGFIVAIVLAIPTLGLTTLAFGPLAATPLIGILYSGITVGGARQATLGQRAMDLQMARNDGEPIDFLYGAAHALLFYLSIVFLTPVVLIVCLFDTRKRLLHDIVLGMVVRRVTP